MKNYLVVCALFLLLAGCASGPRLKKMEFVHVKGGCFQMGDVFGEGEADEQPAHEVCVKDFSMSKYEVTQHQWQEMMGNNPASFKDCGPDCPVESVDFNTIQEFIKALNKSKGAHFRLPTEAEWEYAARSGGKREKWAGTDNDEELTDYAWFSVNSGGKRHPVGTLKPNGLGLYDMSGNVREWCLDWYDETYYASSPKDDPAGPATGQKRVLRGGIFADDARMVRTGARASDVVDVADGDQGFRLVRPEK